MAVSALGLSSATHLAAAGERVSSSSSTSSSSSSSSSSSPPSSSSFLSSASSLSSAFCTSSGKVFSEATRGSFRVPSLASRTRLPWVRHNYSRVRSSFQADAGIAEPPPEVALSPASLSTSASSSMSEATLETGPPTIDLEFLGLEQGPDGLPVVDKVSVTSGEKVLRTVMNEQKLELYGLYGKIMNCGGGGSCGTCIVEVLEGSDLLNEQTDAEERYLKKNPSTWRLACQTIVGDKSNSGKVVVQRLPQKKK